MRGGQDLICECKPKPRVVRGYWGHPHGRSSKAGKPHQCPASSFALLRKSSCHHHHHHHHHATAGRQPQQQALRRPSPLLATSPSLRARPLLLSPPPAAAAAAAPSPLSLPLLLPLSLPLDPRLISTSINASLSLVSVCGFIILIQKYGYLPSNTATMLSQVSFNLVIPCFLMSKLSKTISLQQDWRFLALPLMALIQIIVGSILGRLACIFLYKRSSYMSEGGNNGLSAKEALITTACAFGNPITLPLVFLKGMLSERDYTVAAGYLALFMVGWSPCLWTLGYQILSSTSGSLRTANKNLFSLHKLADWLKKLLNPPLYGVLIGFLVGATPLAYNCLPAKHVLDANRTEGLFFLVCSMMSSILQPILQGANLLGSATVPLQAIVLASSIGSNEDNKEHLVTASSLHESYIANDTILEGKAFWVITVIRLFVMPLISFFLLMAFQHQRWLLADPLSQLILLVVAAMPTGQNLVVLAQYLISAVSLTVWLPIFFSFLGLD